MTQQTMNNAEGNAIAYQLESMIKALAPFENPAGEAGDQDVLALLAKLSEARDAAVEIATRAPLPKGVTLAR